MHYLSCLIMLIIEHVELILECMLCLCNSTFTSLFLNYDCNKFIFLNVIMMS